MTVGSIRSRSVPRRTATRPFDHEARRARGPRAAHRDRRGPRPRRPARHPGRVARAYAEMFRGLRQTAGRRADHHLRPRPRRDGAGQGHRALQPCASTTSCRSTASRTSATSPTRTAGSPACRSWPDSSTSSPSGRRCRSGSPPRSPTRSSRILEPRGVIVVFEASTCACRCAACASPARARSRRAVRGSCATRRRAPRRWSLILGR